jgi:acetyl-CoA carboxylase carboxyl transferase subunit alpha
MNERKNKFLKIGRNQGFISNSEDFSTLTIKQDKLSELFKSKKIKIGLGLVSGLVILIIILNLF